MAEAATCIIQHKEGGYLRRAPNNKWVRASAKAEATLFTAQKAQNVLSSSIKSNERDRWQIVTIPNPATPASEMSAFIPPSQLQRPMQQKAPAAPNAPCIAVHAHTALPNSPIDLTRFAIEQAETYKQLQAYHAALPAELSKIDAEINDLLHYIELTNLNAADGYRIYARLRECRLRRRVLKNDMAKFAALAEATMDDLLSGKLTAAMEAIDNKQVYKPRQLPELFADLA